MPSQYFTDREFGEKPRATEQIDHRVWGAVISLIETKIDNGSFGYRFPLVCDDSGRQPFGCDRSAFALMLQAEVPRVEWPLRQDVLPEAPDILDLLEFCCSAVGQPIQKSWHQFFDHHHLSWDRDSGLASFVADINRLFARNGIAFELSSAGSVSRCLPASLQQMVTQAHFSTGDRITDELLETSRLRILSPRQEDRRDGLEKLWDAFERVKTLEPGPKSVSADVLLDAAARSGTKMRGVLADEARALTAIGNQHLIRHSETTQEPLETALQVDYLFARMFAFLYLQLKASGRAN